MKFDISTTFENYDGVYSLTKESPTMSSRGIHEAIRLGQRLQQDHDKYYDQIEQNSNPYDLPIRPQRLPRTTLQDYIARLQAKSDFMKGRYDTYKEAFEEYERKAMDSFQKGSEELRNSQKDPE